MDKTPKYLKMCEKAKKIQEQLRYEAGNFLYCPEDEECIVFPPMYKGWTDKEYIWLPRQDQLQDIYFDFVSDQLDPNDEKISKAAFVMASISELKMLILNWNRAYPPLESYEQLWLVLVMMCKYNKCWSPRREKWVKCQKDWWEVSKEFLEEVEKKIDKEEKENAKSN